MSFIAGNHDAHGKNYSLLYSSNRGASLAPVYDVLNTVGYWKAKPMDRKMAMKVGGENRPDYVRRRHLERMFTEGGLGSSAARRRLRSFAARAPAAIADARKELETRHWSDPHLDVIEESCRSRARHLAEIVDEAP